MRRREFTALLSGVATWPAPSRSQGRRQRVAIFHPSTSVPNGGAVKAPALRFPSWLARCCIITNFRDRNAEPL
jgi:hypothetical protein